MDRVRILKQQRVFNDVFAIDEAVLEHRKHDGSWSGPTRQLCFERGDSVAVLLVKRETGALVLVNQFRYPYEVENLRPITTFYVSPGGTSERVLLFYGEVSEATRVAAGEGLGVGDEDIRVIETTPAELWDDTLAGRQQDAKTIIALLWWRLNYMNQGR